MTTKPTIAFAVQEETEHGVTRVVARPVLVTEAGELHNPQFRFGNDPESALADLEVYTYVDRDSDEWKTYGHLCEYAPLRVDARLAEVIVKSLRRIRKGLDRADSEQGYLSNDADGWAGYLFRIAAILGIRAYYVRNSDRGQETTGERYRRTDGAGVQSWLSNLAHEHDKARAATS
jgi:hypothetical protein